MIVAKLEQHSDRRLRFSLTVRLLVSCTSAWATELLRLAASRVGDQERAVVLNEDVLDLLLRRLVDVLLEVRDNSLRYGLTNRVDLGHVTTTADAHLNVDARESKLREIRRAVISLDRKLADNNTCRRHGRRVLVVITAVSQSVDLPFLAEQQDGLEQLVLERLRFDHVHRAAVDANVAITAFAERDRRGGLLAAEHLHGGHRIFSVDVDATVSNCSQQESSAICVLTRKLQPFRDATIARRANALRDAGKGKSACVARQRQLGRPAPPAGRCVRTVGNQRFALDTHF